jgi:hypothetical protein
MKRKCIVDGIVHTTYNDATCMLNWKLHDDE